VTEGLLERHGSKIALTEQGKHAVFASAPRRASAR
jgi:hypothetical protein